MFDRPEWWELLLLITPLALAIYGLRWRESRKANSSYKSLSSAQRGYALLHYLPPGVSAQFWSDLSPSEREAYLSAGREIKGTGKYLLGPLVKDVLRFLAEGKSKAPSTESSDPMEKLALAAEFCAPQLFQVLRRHFPAGNDQAA